MNRARLLPSSVLIAIMGMEASYLYLGLALVREHLGLEYLPLVLIMALYVLPVVIEFIAGAFPGIVRIVPPLTHSLSIALVLAVVTLTIRQVLVAGYPVAGVIVALGFCGLAWWLGNTLIHLGTSYRAILFRFQAGVLFLIIFAGADTLLPVLLFYVLALLALARARWEDALSRSRGVLQSYSFPRIVLGAVAVFMAAAVITLVVSPDIAGDILHWFSNIYGSSTRLFAEVLSSEFWHKPLVNVNWQLSCVPEMPVDTAPKPTLMLPDQTTAMPPLFLGIALAVFCLIVILMITFAVLKLRANRKSSHARMVSFETRSSRVSILRELVSMLYGIWNGLRHWLQSLWVGKVGRFKATPSGAVTSVRVIYQDLLRWAQKQAVPRHQSQTAIEYLKVLCHRFPEEAEALAAITRAYIQDRYGCDPLTREEFEVARRAWQKLVLTN